MSGLFSKPKIPDPKPVDPLPPAPERTAEETARLAEEQRRVFSRRSGRAGTMLTGGQGTAGAASAVSFLGGAART